MFKTKKDVDKHVTEIFSKIKNENERHLRGYNIAKQYYFVKDFETAIRYLAGFLMIKETSAPAHKLMGEIYEKTGQLDKALQSFKRSLELDERQNDIILKICELYCHIPVDPDRGKYWADRAEILFPHNNIVFKLRECLVNGDGDHNVQEYEDLIVNELLVRPHDVSLRTKLLKLYLDTERTEIAYKHAVDVEKKAPYHNSVDWYYCLVDIFEAYLEDLSNEYTPDVCVHLLKALDRLVTLNLDHVHKIERENRNERNVATSMACATALQRFDMHLLKSWQLKHNVEMWKCFLSYMKGQLYFHMATVIFKRAKQEHGNQKEASRMGASLLLAAYSFKPHNLQSSWYLALEPTEKSVYKALHQQACYRLTQCGHVILGLCREDRAKWLGRSRDYVATMQSKEKIYQRVFNNKGHRSLGYPASYFLEADIMSVVSQEFPDIHTLKDYNLIGHTLHSNSLHHLVWIALQYYNGKRNVHPDYGFKVFDGLQYNVAKLDDSSPESLCFLDVEAFLYATVRCSALALEDHHSLSYVSPDMPPYLPAAICDPLCTPEQAEWWMAAYSLFTNESSKNFGELRRKVQRGIEVIRVLGNHGMDVTLVVHLAQIYMNKAADLSAQLDGSGLQSVTTSGLETRATLYWKAAVQMMEQQLKNIAIRLPKERMFPTYGRQLSGEELKKLLEEGKFFLACQIMNAGKYEMAISEFESLMSPHASFYQALAYKKLAVEEFGSKPRESITSEMRSRHIILLTHARDALYVTLDRIRGDKKHPLNHELPGIIEDIETRLARIDPDTAQRLEFGGSEDSFSRDSEEQDPDSCTQLDSTHVSKLESSRHIALSRMLNVSSSIDGHGKKFNFSSRQQGAHLVPSPERLDAQIRSIASWQDTLVKTIVEQNKTLLDTNNAIVEGLKQNKAAIEQLTGQLQEFTKHIPLITKDFRRRLRAPPSELRSLQHNFKPAREEVEEDGDHDDDYYDGYYYEDDRDYDEAEGGDRENQEIRRNPAYSYPDPPLHSEYPYGNTTGMHGTSTITYAPPTGGSRVMPHGSGYHSYYSQAANISGPSLTHPGGGIMQGQPHSVPSVSSPYFSQGPPAMFTGLPFSEGQKLPEFNFNVAAPTINGAPADNGSKFTLQQFPPTAVLNTAAVPSGEGLPITGINMSTPIVTNVEQQHAFTPTKSTADIGATSAAHAFQITLPPQAVVISSPTIIQPSTISESNNSTIAISGGVNFNADGASDTRTPLRSNSEAEESFQEEDAVGQEYKPVIPLPAEVVMKTGEEDEVVLFEDRAKLFRYTNKEWKERGIGNVKILHNEQTGRSRIVMRRDHVLKTCANHGIYPDMTLTSAKNSDKAWVWAAQDYADGVLKTEQFYIRFKCRDIALLFREKFDWAKSLPSKGKLSDSVTDHRSDGVTLSMERDSNGKDHIIDRDAGPALHDVENAPSTKWMGVNLIGQPPQSATSNGNRCAYFQDSTAAHVTGKMTSPILIEESLGSTSDGTSFVFGGACASPPPKSSGFEFGASPAKPSLSPDLQTQSEKNIIVGGFSFKVPPVFKVTKEDDSKNDKDVKTKDAHVDKTSSLSEATKASPFAGFTFNPTAFTPVPVQEKNAGLAPSLSILKDSKQVNIGKELESGESSFIIGSGSNVSNISFTSLSKGAVNSDAFKKDASFEGFSRQGEKVFANTSDGKLSRTLEEDFEPDVHFNPVVHLPQVVDLKTGEEDEEKLFGERARLYRYNVDTKEWKERGVGEIKILKNRLTKRLRILMRREQVLKICANHNITADMKLQPMSTTHTAWIWCANDFSDGELQPEKLAVKFKNVELANSFKEAFEKAQHAFIQENGSELGEQGTSPSIKLKLVEGSWVCTSCDTENGSELKRCFSCLSAKPVTTVCNSQALLSALSAPIEGTSECSTRLVRSDKERVNSASYESPTVGSGALTDSTSKTSFPNFTSNAAPLSEVFKPSEGSWECSTCLVRNDKDRVKCASCESPKVGSGALTDDTSSKISFPNFTSNAAPLSEVFKPTEGSWECSTCLVRNDKDRVKCASCDSPKVGSGALTDGTSSKISFPNFTSSTAPLSEVFKPTEGSWECSTCLVRNDKDRVKCASCESPKVGSGSLIDSASSKIPFPNFTSSAPLSELFRPSKGSWECSTCLVRNDRGRVTCVSCQTPEHGLGTSIDTRSTTTLFSSSTPTFKFGFKSPIDIQSTASTGFSFMMPTPNVSFGTAQQDATSDISSSVEFRFGTPQKFSFSFGGIRPISPTKTPKSPLDESTEGEVDDDVVGGESEGDSIYFHPQIPLPDKVEVRTGEEEEEVLYCQRAKLYRLADGEWKERGLGDFKILHHRTSGKVRFVMRREQVLKICCNHYLAPDIAFRTKDDRSWLWCAIDFSDNEAKQETLALRFKTPELAKAFKQAVDEAKQRLTDGGLLPLLDNDESTSSVQTKSAFASFSFKVDDAVTSTSSKGTFSFGDRFSKDRSHDFRFGGSSQKPVSFDFTCQSKDPISEVSESKAVPDNDELSIVFEKKSSADQEAKARSLMLPPNFYEYKNAPPCQGCRGCSNLFDEETTPVDDSEVDVVWESTPTKEQRDKALLLMLPPTFYLYENRPPCRGCRGCTDDIPTATVPSLTMRDSQDGSGRVGTILPSRGEPSKEEPPFSPFLSGAAQAISFADLSSKVQSGFTFNEGKKGVTFEGAGAVVFGSQRQTSSSNDHDDEQVRQADIHFDPVMPLPKLITVTTGEEDEDKLFCSRCKLYRFDANTKQWKERGIGGMKILKHRITGKFRILMRWDQIHKICCNHALTVEMVLMPLQTSSNSWCWYAYDFSEEKEVLERFAVRFKNADIAEEFRSCFHHCQALLAEGESKDK